MYSFFRRYSSLSNSNQCFSLQLGQSGSLRFICCWILGCFILGYFLTISSWLSYLLTFWYLLICVSFCTWYCFLRDFGSSRSPNIFFFNWMDNISFILYFYVMSNIRKFHLFILNYIPSNQNDLYSHNRTYHNKLTSLLIW